MMLAVSTGTLMQNPYMADGDVVLCKQDISESEGVARV